MLGKGELLKNSSYVEEQKGMMTNERAKGF